MAVHYDQVEILALNGRAMTMLTHRGSRRCVLHEVSQCEEPRSGCVNIESVMPLEQISHLPTSINEDDTNTVSNDGFPQVQNKVEGNLNKLNNGIISRSKIRTPSISMHIVSESI